MARIRSIKPELWLSPQVMNLCHGARLLFIGLITQADDDGRGAPGPPGPERRQWIRWTFPPKARKAGKK